MAKYLDQAGLQLVLQKITNKYDGRYLGLHATADAAEKVVHKLTINVRDEESRVFDGSADFEINVAQAEHIHPATEVTYSNGSVTGAANVKEALDIIVKNIQISSAAISNATNNMNALNEALNAEVTAREEADAAIQAELDALEEFVEERLDGEGNIFDILEQAKDFLQEAIDAEALARKNADEALQGEIDACEDRLEIIEGDENKEGSIKKAVNDEKVRAMAAEKTLTDNLAAEKQRAEAKEQEIAEDLADEVTRATEAESGLGERIQANLDAINILNGEDTVDGSVAKDIKDAEARVKVVTDALDGRMTSAEGRLDVIQGTGEGSIKKAVADLVDGAPETLDTLRELAEALRENPEVLDAVEKAFDDKLALLQADVDQNEADCDAAIQAEQEARAAAVSAEETARKAADAGLDARLLVVEGKVKAEDMTLAEVKAALEANDQAIKTEVQDRKDAVKGVQDQIDIIDGAVDVEGSFRKAIADQAAVQLAKDQAQDGRMDDIEEEMGTKGSDSADSTGMYQFIFQQVEAEAQARSAADTTHDNRLAAIEELIGDGEGSTTLKDLNQRLTQAEADIDQCQADIIQNAKDIAAIVALEEADIDAAFAAIFQ